MKESLIAVLLSTGALCTALAEQTGPPQAQIDSALKTTLETRFPLYRYQRAEVTTTLIPGSLIYQVEFKGFLTPKHDICINADVPTEVIAATKAYKGLRNELNRISMIRASVRHRYKSQIESARSISPPIACQFLRVIQSDNQPSIVYGKCIADRTVDLWRFSPPEIVDRSELHEGTFAPSGAVVLGTSGWISFKGDLEARLAKCDAAEKQLSMALQQALQEQANLHDPSIRPLRDLGTKNMIVTALAKFIEKLPRASGLELANYFADPVEDFYGKGPLHRADIINELNKDAVTANGETVSPDESVASVYIVEDGMRYFVRLPVTDEFSLNGVSFVQRDVFLFTVLAPNDAPLHIQVIDMQPIKYSGPLTTTAEPEILSAEEHEEAQAARGH